MGDSGDWKGQEEGNLHPYSLKKDLCIALDLFGLNCLMKK